MSDVVKWTDDANAFFNANATTPLPVAPMAGGTGAAAQQVQGNIASAATDSGNPVKIGGKANGGVPSTVTDGQRIDLWSSSRGAIVMAAVQYTPGDLATNVATQPAGHNGTNAPLAMYPFVFNGAQWDRQKKPNLISRLISSAATTNATSVKASAGDVTRIQGNNTVASKRYLKLYNKASAPTVGTDTPVMTIALLASAGFDFNLGANGTYFSTGIAYAITGAAADADTTAIGAGDIECFNLVYTG